MSSKQQPPIKQEPCPKNASRLAIVPCTVDAVWLQVHVRMRSMWEDCLSDVADELWCAVQAVGASRQAVATLQVCQGCAVV